MSATRSSLLTQLKGEAAEHAWEEFLKIYRPLILRTVRGAGVRPQDIDDAVQDVLVQLLRVLPTFSYQRKRGFFRHWLRHVTTNKAIDFHRRRTGCLNIGDQLEGVSSPVSDDHWMREFRLGMLQTAMASLESEFRSNTWKCFVLHALENRPAEETARAVGVSTNAVYINTSRVVSRLREFCEFHGEVLCEEVSAFESADRGSRMDRLSF
ncbi:RNA polymerase sigma factor [Planctomicrobium sp. SH527]|uniref:RNA polymerase sigma factor n=1 Tax=Planctomicrobium sp. SH527 TaxID=3448123 RepID=UPI003F5B6150